MVKRIIYTISSLAVFYCLVATSQAALSMDKASQGLREAIALYSDGQFANALDKLNSLSDKEGSSAMARYYKGLCYQQTNQTDAAQREYYWVYSQGKDASLKYKAWQGLKSIASRKPKTTKALANTGTDKTKTAKAEKGPGSDAWVTPGEDYGYSGPAPTSSFTFIRKQKACGRR